MADVESGVGWGEVFCSIFFLFFSSFLLFFLSLCSCAVLYARDAFMYLRCTYTLPLILANVLLETHSTRCKRPRPAACSAPHPSLTQAQHRSKKAYREKNERR